MRKLIEGIARFRRERRPGYRETFAKLALGQLPDALFIACSDSRVAANVFASTEPGDLFVVRNVGNMVSPSDDSGASVAAAVEFALLTLGVSDIIVCGHSECGAMQALCRGRELVQSPNLRSWLRHGDGALRVMRATEESKPLPQGPRSGELAPHNRLSQLNVLEQINNLMSYSLVSERVQRGELRLHGWWFDIANAEVLAYDDGQFVVIDDAEAQRLLKRLC